MYQRSLAKRIWYRVLQRILQLTGVAAYRVRYSGVENIPAEGALLVLANHQSYLDPPLIGIGSPRRMNYMARATLFDFAPLAWLISSVDAIPIDQEGIALSGIKESLRRLKWGELLLVFPEGSRTPDGQIKPFLPGFTTLAVRSRSSILPVAIEGAYDAWPCWRKFPRLGTIHVHYGKPISAEEIARFDERELLPEVERRVRECHARLLRHGVFRRRKSR